MRQIIDRKLYDTDAAEEIAEHAPNTDRSDLYYLVEALYKTDDGEYFLHGAGGAATKYATSHSNGKSGGEEITVLSEDDAVDWCEDHSIDAEIILEEFGHLIES
ncbi:conserved hypothetical protein (plasmid) [Halorubrum lacusprofundi ATCC 49239]|jgi:hypothetical protein|uniref:Uncharacterized protein n=1 Tax=Halorubrum lacusprofundi (strain ATCC 49239 / DSM 5036 / JCM 8891 / ACAM 34) TaxID=416348 RepID=B9LWH4_HALLT|nr:hypothetical protein [Halorubrum lacusprofundi]ACM58815.1 conserved hypothetical protein [Halorubrum lacusprofundi ATCC 49239]